MLKKLIKWYQENPKSNVTDENYAIKISTLDNPGWSLIISLKNTQLANQKFNMNIERTEHDWLFCKLEKEMFEGNCGPLNLEEMLNIFYSWAKI